MNQHADVADNLALQLLPFIPNDESVDMQKGYIRNDTKSPFRNLDKDPGTGESGTAIRVEYTQYTPLFSMGSQLSLNTKFIVKNNKKSEQNARAIAAANLVYQSLGGAPERSMLSTIYPFSPFHMRGVLQEFLPPTQFVPLSQLPDEGMSIADAKRIYVEMLVLMRAFRQKAHFPEQVFGISLLPGKAAVVPKDLNTQNFFIRVQHTPEGGVRVLRTYED